MKGSVAFILVVFLSLIVMIFGYTQLSMFYASIYPEMRTQINETNYSTAEANSVINRMEATWQYWVIFLLFCVFVLMIAAVQKREPHHTTLGY